MGPRAAFPTYCIDIYLSFLFFYWKVAKKLYQLSSAWVAVSQWWQRALLKGAIISCFTLHPDHRNARSWPLTTFVHMFSSKTQGEKSTHATFDVCCFLLLLQSSTGSFPNHTCAPLLLLLRCTYYNVSWLRNPKLLVGVVIAQRYNHWPRCLFCNCCISSQSDSDLRCSKMGCSASKSKSTPQERAHDYQRGKY